MTLYVAAFSTAAAATPLAVDHWEIVYDLSDSTLDLDTIVGPTSGIPIGAPEDTLILQLEGEPSGLITDGGAARLAHLQLTANFTVSNATINSVTVLMGDAHGTFSAGSLQVTWATSATDLVTSGTLVCNGAFCQSSGLPLGFPIDLDETPRDFVVDDLQFILPSLDIQLSWLGETLLDGAATPTFRLLGQEISRSFVTAPLPEPTAGVLVALGLIGIGATRRRRR